MALERFRKTLASLELIEEEWEPRYNIAPGQEIAVVRNDEPTRLRRARWGLVPSWATEANMGNRLINARAETLSEKPAFRTAARRHHCLIPADGFYEWAPVPGSRTKQPYAFQFPDDRVLAFAGLWEMWRSPQGDALVTCAIITTAASTQVAPYHHRMPLILPPSSFAAWLTPGDMPPDQLADFVATPPPTLEIFPVSAQVNDVRIDSPECLVRIDASFSQLSLPM